jgi:hypothetical protein
VPYFINKLGKRNWQWFLAACLIFYFSYLFDDVNVYNRELYKIEMKIISINDTS